jgi:hypothetical protein
MEKILIGSRALQHYIDVSTNDIDYATRDIKKTIREDNIRVEYKPIPMLFNYPEHVNQGVASLDMLYTLKCSHASWDIHWGKTMRDICLMQTKNAKLIPELYQELYAYWETIHGSKKHINLNVTNEDFFDNGLTYIINHDRLHEKYKFYDEPLYKKCKKDTEKALLSKEIFESWDHKMQIQLAQEEMLVIAEERKLGKPMALKKIITSLSRGWFNLFCITNAKEIIQYTK